MVHNLFIDTHFVPLYTGYWWIMKGASNLYLFICILFVLFRKYTDIFNGIDQLNEKWKQKIDNAESCLPAGRGQSSMANSYSFALK